MGLDITVRKLRKATEEDKENGTYFTLVDENLNYKNDFPEWSKKYETSYSETYYDWDKFKENTGIDISLYNCTRIDFCEESVAYFKNKNEELTIKLKDVPTKEVDIKIIGFSEIGYQRKGLNNKFYEDYDDEKIGYFVWDKKELERYKEDYCDEDSFYVYPNGEKSDYLLTPKEDFQRNIIDKFIEDECCVTFSW